LSEPDPHKECPIMKITTISVTYERKINLGDYNSAHIGLTLWADLDEEDDATMMAAHLQRQARELAKLEYKRLANPDRVPANGTIKE